MTLVFKTVDVIDNNATGNAAREARNRADKTLRVVANRMKVSAAFLSDLELGRRNWTEENMRLFSMALK